MSKQTRIIGIVRPWTGHPEDRQREAVKAAGATVIYSIPDECPTWRRAVGFARKGDTIVIEWLQLIAEPKSQRVPRPAMDMVDALDEIRDRQTVLIETGSGRTTADPKQRKAMRDDAAKSLGAGGRSLSSEQARINGAKAGTKRGRPRNPLADANYEAAAKIWNSRLVATWADADALLRPLGWTMWRARKEIGLRGAAVRKPRR